MQNNNRTNTWAMLRPGVKQASMIRLHDASRRGNDTYRVAAGIVSVLCDYALSTDKIVELMNTSIKRAVELDMTPADQMVKMFDKNFL